MMEIRRIAVPVDFSENATATIAAASDLASRYGSELYLVHVVEPWQAAAMASLEPYPTEPAEQQLAAIAVSEGISRGVHRSVRVGEAVSEILKFAEHRNIDLIVMGSHGRTGLSHLFLGSVAEAVVRRASCPVMVIRNSCFPDAQRTSATSSAEHTPASH